ncbi:hypothetical protein TVAG_366120 [Trichomonas vaginalis G3]|uniref:Uncharacterized protein n=1 Tax=Trichomonas vaginalis (strain ATCC PRA-98 / G3) TaxID=412133 RepID=A2DHQ6_TRIV3|nr:hypothetical protein TVAGG3_0303170 [Trichomonas vaginalis G3]EAY20104.1 hypothetical protein TVAG_366120 [Trichomonas vaginalis G3]KAI5528057.1 hypothetical protein TVAGG3_0303170 [Trichomonas vaginalis G3]|eukprot:XP_001581090.1 hypothetical protein [Trichomonas vaginalis G3]
MEELFRFSFDDSGVRKVLNAHSEELKKHQEEIDELRRLLRDRPSFTDIDKMKEGIQNDYDKKISDLQNYLNDLEASMNKRFEQLHDEINGLPGKLQANTPKFDSEAITKQLGQLEEKLKVIENNVNKNSQDLQKSNNYLEIMTCAYAAINNRNAPLDQNLRENLNQTTAYIVNTFKRLNEKLNDHDHLLSQLQSDLSKKAEARDFVPEENPQVVNNVINNTNIDLSGIGPRPKFKANWEMRPDLPEINKFNDVVEAVDYIYKVLPPLQGFLYALHDRIDDITETMPDVSGIEKLLQSLRNSLSSMDGDLSQLKNALKKGLTRQDVMDIISSMMQDLYTTSSVGAVKCIACRREVTQVAGAITEVDALKTLGAPPNALAMIGTPNRVANMYSNDNVLENGMIESPRSTRSFRSTARSISRRRGPL